MVRIHWYNFTYSYQQITNQTQQLMALSGVTLAPGEAITLEKTIHDNGRIIGVYISYPTGVNGTIILKLNLNGREIFPSEGYFTGSGFTQIFALDEKVMDGDKLTLEVYNIDTQAHTIQFMVMQLVENEEI